MKHFPLSKTPGRVAPMLMVALMMLLAAGPAHAGDPEGPRDRSGPEIEKRVAHMAVELDLTDEQSQQLLAVLETTAMEREALQEEMDKQFKPELCALHRSTKQQIRQILTAEQAAEMEDRMDRWTGAGGHRGGWKGGPRLDCKSES